MKMLKVEEESLGINCGDENEMQVKFKKRIFISKVRSSV